MYIFLVTFCTTLFFFELSANQWFTIIHDELFSEDIRNVKIYVAEHQNNSIQLESLKIPRKPTFNQIANVKFNKKSVVMTFTALPMVVHTTPDNSYNFGMSYGQLMTMFHQPCLKYTTAFKHSVSATVKNLLAKNIAIIIDSSDCLQRFSHALSREITYKNNAMTIHNLTLGFKRQFQKKDFYDLKNSQVNLIVLLAPVEHYGFVCKMAHHFNLITSSTTWMVPNLTKQTLPMFRDFNRLIYFEDISLSHEPYVDLKSSILPLIATYQKAVHVCRRYQQMKHCISARLHQTMLQYKDRYPIKIAMFERNIYEFGNGTFLRTNVVVTKNTVTVDQPEKSSIFRTSLLNEQVKRFRAVTILDPPFVYENFDSYNQETETCLSGITCQNNGPNGPYMTCCVGYGVSLFLMILKDINVDFTMYVVEDNRYGVVDRKGKWNGMIGDVMNGKADLAMAALAISHARSQVVDFTVPFSEQIAGIVTRPEAEELELFNWKFISPLSGDLQLFLWFLIIGFMILNYLLENNIYMVSLANEKYAKEKYYSIFESMTYIGGVTMQRDLGGLNPKKLGARLPALAFAFGMVILITTYTAMLAAQSLQNEEKNPFKGSNDERMRNPTPDFTFALVRSTSYEMYLNSSKVDVHRRMSRFMEKYNVASISEGVQKVKNGTLNAFMDDYMFLFWYTANDNECKLRLVEDSIARGGTGLAIAKNSFLLRPINDAIMRLRENEVIELLQKKWFTKFCQPVFLVTTKTALTIKHFGGIVMVLLATCIICFPLLLFERYYYKKNMHQNITTTVKKKFNKSGTASNASDEEVSPIQLKLPMIDVDRMRIVRFPTQ